MNKEYTYKDLLHVYLEVQRPSRVDEEDEYLSNYYPKLLPHLEKAFGIRFSWDNIDTFTSRALFSLFDNTVESYKKLGNPWSNYLEATLLIRKLEEKGEIGEKVLTISNSIYELTENNEKLHIEMLYLLFECIYGTVNTIVTSEQLKAAGFDDTTGPKPWNYEWWRKK